jgi:hypothetical protein
MRMPSLEWSFVVAGATVARGTLHYSHHPFQTCTAGQITFAVPDVVEPQDSRLYVTLAEGGRAATNRWSLWVFPTATRLPDGIALYGTPQYTWLRNLCELPIVPQGQTPDPRRARAVLTERLDDTLVGFLQRGGRAVLAASEGLVRPFRPKLGLEIGRYFFTPPANYPPHEDGLDGTVIVDHPMLGAFPHEGFADLQFYRLFAESPPIDLDHFGPRGWDPVFRAIHCYPVGRSLGYLAEASVGSGTLILSALNLDRELPEARYLTLHVCRYATEGPFGPMTTLEDRHVSRLIKATGLS